MSYEFLITMLGHLYSFERSTANQLTLSNICCSFGDVWLKLESITYNGL